MITESATGSLCPDSLGRDAARSAVRELLNRCEELQAALNASNDTCLMLAAWNAELQAQLDAADIKAQEQRLTIEGLRQGQGKHKSEKLTPAKREQLGLPETPKACDPATRLPAKKKRKGGGRGPLSRALPVLTRVIDLPPEERKGLVYLRTEVTEKLECEPRRFYLLRIERRVYGSKDRSTPPIMPPLPPQVIPKAAVSVSFIVHILVSKYVDHIPLYRQACIDERDGVVVRRNKRSRYVEEAALLLRAIHEQLKMLILSGRYIHIDEAFTKVLDRKRKGKARVAYMWGFYGPEVQAMYMEFSLSRGHEILLGFLPKEWTGGVHSDGAKMYTSALQERPNIVHYECVNHLRRYVLEAVECGQKEAVPLLEGIGELYDIETEATERGLTPEQRADLRHAKARPVLERLKAKFDELKKRDKPSGESDGSQKRMPLLGKLRTAVNYGVARWKQLARYAEAGNGHICIDQNPIERQWRGQKVGQRNHLFIGHPDAGWQAAVIYSVVATCRLVGVDPAEYLTWVLPKLAAAKTTTASGLLPHDFKQLKLAQAAAAKQRPPTVHSPCSTRPPTGHRRPHAPHRPPDTNALAA
jgi:transposase